MFLFNKTKYIADYIIYTLNSQSIQITHLKLQKLMYFCQKLSLKRYNISLFNEDFEAWIHGPVLPIIYKKYAFYGWNNLPSSHFKPFLLNQDKEVVDTTLNKYKYYTGKELEILSHKELAWINARKGLLFSSPSNNLILKENIKNL